jgi:hypothetical protein
LEDEIKKYQDVKEFVWRKEEVDEFKKKYDQISKKISH